MKIHNSLPKLTYTVEFANKFSDCEFFDGILHWRQNQIVAAVWPWQILQLLSNLIALFCPLLLDGQAGHVVFQSRETPNCGCSIGKVLRQWKRQWDSSRGSVGGRIISKLKINYWGEKKRSLCHISTTLLSHTCRSLFNETHLYVSGVIGV
ncbi:hypothetical protein RHMOL_Rhmol02G0027500 [Rhododendron molle]|uniref:Uncharacterized protein n=1 Tax=Rhododendron molle TaxID=49168 RepID=A0ACC0PL76_RHOML|nr:hypothetical protein RHMOL_Rhmol02G0027500 [Rhododendron molle]